MKAAETDNASLCGALAAAKEDLRVQNQDLVDCRAELQRNKDEVQLLQRELAKLEDKQAKATTQETERGKWERERVEEVATLRTQL